MYSLENLVFKLNLNMEGTEDSRRARRSLGLGKTMKTDALRKVVCDYTFCFFKTIRKVVPVPISELFTKICPS